MQWLNLHLILIDSTRKPIGYCDIPSDTLRESLKNVELAEKEQISKKDYNGCFQKGQCLKFYLDVNENNNNKTVYIACACTCVHTYVHISM